MSSGVRIASLIKNPSPTAEMIEINPILSMCLLQKLMSLVSFMSGAPKPCRSGPMLLLDRQRASSRFRYSESENESRG